MPDSAVLLRGAMSAFSTPVDMAAPTLDTDDAALAMVANVTEIAAGLITDDGVTLSHTETIEDEMVLNETVAIDDYRTAEEWMLNLTVKSWQADVLQLVMNNNAATTTAAGSGTVGYIRIPMRKGPSVHKMGLTARVNDTPYRVTGLAVLTQVHFFRVSQRDGFESNLGPKQQGAMVSLNFKALLSDTLDEVGYIDLTNAPAT